MQRSWSNPYIEKLSDFPEMIVGTGDRGLTDAEKQRVSSAPSNWASVVCEFGSGSGRFLIEHAQKNPSRLHMGFELRFKRVVRTAEKATELGLKNILILKTAAEEAPNLIQPQSLDAIFINFPDPWDKRRWKKHRMLSPEFMVVMHRLLKPSGYFAYKTDHHDYFNDTVEELVKSNLFSISKISRDYHASEFVENNIFTEFELLFKSKRMPICFLNALPKMLA